MENIKAAEYLSWVTGISVAAITLLGDIGGKVHPQLAVFQAVFTVTSIEMWAGIILGIGASQGNFINVQHELFEQKEAKKGWTYLSLASSVLLVVISAYPLLVRGALATALLFAVGGAITAALSFYVLHTRTYGPAQTETPPL